MTRKTYAEGSAAHGAWRLDSPGADDAIRTRDPLDGDQELYRLSYVCTMTRVNVEAEASGLALHVAVFTACVYFAGRLERATGFEPVTSDLEGRRSTS